MILNILTFIVSVLALISSIQIGRKQYELSKWQAEAQNKVELYLPTDGTTHVSLQIDFEDWQKKQWTTKGVADWEDGIWKITYQPCVRCAEQLPTREEQICKP